MTDKRIGRRYLADGSDYRIPDPDYLADRIEPPKFVANSLYDQFLVWAIARSSPFWMGYHGHSEKTRAASVFADLNAIARRFFGLNGRFQTQTL